LASSYTRRKKLYRSTGSTCNTGSATHRFYKRRSFYPEITKNIVTTSYHNVHLFGDALVHCNKCWYRKIATSMVSYQSKQNSRPGWS